MCQEVRRQLDKLVTMAGRLPTAEALRENVEGIRHVLGILDDHVQNGPRPPEQFPDLKTMMDDYKEEHSRDDSRRWGSSQRQSPIRVSRSHKRTLMPL
jgi:hypothetical protein